MRVAPPKCYAILIVDNGAEINCVIGHLLRQPTSHPIFTRLSAPSNEHLFCLQGRDVLRQLHRICLYTLHRPLRDFLVS